MAPPIVLIFAEERSILSADAPTAEQIEAALLPLASASGGWIGPRARVTRTAGFSPRFSTFVAWPFAWRQPAVPDLAHAPVTELLRRVNNALSDTSWSWQGARALPYTEAVNGNLAWWNSGAASQTRTRNSFPTGAGHFDADENPTGPTDATTHPSTPGDTLSHAAAASTDLATALAWLAGIGLAGYLAVNVAPLFRPRRRYR